MLAAGRPEQPEAARALEELCAQYWHPVYAYARRRGNSAEDARDLTQGFFADMLEKGSLVRADPQRGRFRTFLLAAMKNHVAGQWRRGQALKRGGGFELLQLDFDSGEISYQATSANELSPEAAYDRRWALDILDQALKELRDEYRQTGNEDVFDALAPSVAADPGALPYADLAKQLERSQGALRTAASRLRARWRERVVRLVTETVDTPADLEDELRALIDALDGSL